jgi:hydrogenase nickel incorporation protein HypB
MKVKVLQDIMSANDRIAAENREIFNNNKTLAINIMSSPGSGKTSLIIETIKQLRAGFGIVVVEADIASSMDADKIIKEGVQAIQINTGGQCHTDANMLSVALADLNLKDIDLLFLENVGNLVCPAEFKTGVQKNVMLLSVPEGDDKPYKYPLMFSTVDAVIISKMDYLPLADFSIDRFEKAVRGMNPNVHIFHVSVKTGEGLSNWIEWLRLQLKESQGEAG